MVPNMVPLLWFHKVTVSNLLTYIFKETVSATAIAVMENLHFTNPFLIYNSCPK